MLPSLIMFSSYPLQDTDLWIPVRISMVYRVEWMSGKVWNPSTLQVHNKYFCILTVQPFYQLKYMEVARIIFLEIIFLILNVKIVRF